MDYFDHSDQSDDHFYPARLFTRIDRRANYLNNTTGHHLHVLGIDNPEQLLPAAADLHWHKISQFLVDSVNGQLPTDLVSLGDLLSASRQQSTAETLADSSLRLPAE